MLGRKRAFGVEREPNGRAKRPTVDRLKDVERLKRLAETAAVLAQPHRQGDSHPWRASALGRFCQRTKCRRELHDAAIEYLNIRAWWGAAVGRPKGLENLTARGGGTGPSDETVRAWLASFARIDAILAAGPGGSARRLSAFRGLVVDDQDPAGTSGDAELIEALRLVAIHMGRMSGRQTAFE